MKNLNIPLVHSGSAMDNVKCPKCWMSGNCSHYGVLNLDNTQYNVTKCNSCGTLHTQNSDAVQVLIDKVNEDLVNRGQPPVNIGFVGLHHADHMNYANNGNYSDPNLSNEIMYMKNEICNLKYSVENLHSTLREILTAINNLSSNMGSHSYNTGQLIEKLMADPMVAIRKSVSNFNLT